MKLSPNFDDSEFACKDGCGFGLMPGDVDPELVLGLEMIRNHFGAPVYVNDFGGSGCRCPAHNAKIGGVSDSQHMKGKAADIKVKGVPPADVADFAETLSMFRKGGIGRYSTFTHVDVRGHRARWKG